MEIFVAWSSAFKRIAAKIICFQFPYCIRECFSSVLLHLYFYTFYDTFKITMCCDIGGVQISDNSRSASGRLLLLKPAPEVASCHFRALHSGTPNRLMVVRDSNDSLSAQKTRKHGIVRRLFSSWTVCSDPRTAGSHVHSKNRSVSPRWVASP